MQALAATLVMRKPKLFAVADVSAGDALALATRFNCGWAYRGGVALFWDAAFKAHEVHDRYLPTAALVPFERRGLLEVAGEVASKPCTLVAAWLADDRSLIREIRFIRSTLRAIHGEAFLFLANYSETERIGFTDLGFSLLTRDGNCVVLARGQ
jgi:hypothetical protein